MANIDYGLFLTKVSGLFLLHYLFSSSFLTLLFVMYNLISRPSLHTINVTFIALVWSFFGTFELFLIGLAVGLFYFNLRYTAICTQCSLLYSSYKTLESLVETMNANPEDSLIDQDNEMKNAKKLISYVKFFERKYQALNTKMEQLGTIYVNCLQSITTNSYLTSFKPYFEKIFLMAVVFGIKLKYYCMRCLAITYERILLPLFNFARQNKWISAKLDPFVQFFNKIISYQHNYAEQIRLNQMHTEPVSTTMPFTVTQKQDDNIFADTNADDEIINDLDPKTISNIESELAGLDKLMSSLKTINPEEGDAFSEFQFDEKDISQLKQFEAMMSQLGSMAHQLEDLNANAGLRSRHKNNKGTTSDTSA